MLKRLIEFWVGIRSAVRQTRRLKSHLAAMEKTRKQGLRRLGVRRRELDDLKALVDLKHQEVETELENCRTLHRQYAHQLEVMQEKGKVLESTIEALVASNRVYLERWQAETSVQVLRRVGHQVEEPQ